MPRRRTHLLAALALASAVPLVVAPTPATAAVRVPAKPYDFNGDGFPELAASADYVTVGGHPGAGAVYVLPGSTKGCR